jgi:hypothetical protein
METRTVVVSIDEVKALNGDSDAARIAAMTEEEIIQAALSDPDSALPTEEELKQFKPVTPLGGGGYGHKKSRKS